MIRPGHAPRVPRGAVAVVACFAALAGGYGAFPTRAAPDYVPGEAVVLFAGEPSITQHALGSAADGAVVRTLPPRGGAAPVTCAIVRSTRLATPELVETLSRQAGVLAVAPNYIRHTLAATPRDPAFMLQWGLQNTGQSVRGVAGQSDADIDLPEALALSPRTPDEVVVAVIDTGIDPDHPDLVDRLWRNGGEIPNNGYDDDANGFADDCYGYDFAGDGESAPPDPLPLDINEGGHGTHVAGIVAAALNNGQGGAGVGNGARIMALKAAYSDDSFRSADIITAVNYAITMKARGVNIVAINTSFGNSGSYSTAEYLTFQAAINAGIVICAAAGNGGADGVGDSNDLTPVYPANYALSGVISVAASDPFDRLASFSNYGATTVDLAAPGVSIYSTVPRHLTTHAGVTVGISTFPAVGMVFAGTTDGLEAPVINCGFGGAADFPSGVSGNLALIQRGPIHAPLTFAAKVRNAMAAGAVGAIIYNHEVGEVYGSLQTPGDWMPVISVAQSDGQMLVAVASYSGRIRLVNAVAADTPYAYMNGTSMAAPHVSGAVALIAAAFPDDTVATRVSRVLSAVDRRGGLAGRVASSGRLNVANALDADGDALPDWWELNATTNLSAMNTTTDLDRDGMRDGGEYSAGTRPNDATDYLNVRHAGRLGASVSLAWNSVTGITYVVQRAPSPHGPFTDVSAAIPGTPPTNSCLAPPIGAIPTYFRIRIVE